MKNILILFSFAITLVLFTSCSNDSDDDTGPINNPPAGNSVTYANSVKSIIDGNCTSCHGNPLTNNAPMQLLTLDNVKEAVQNRNLIGRVENGTMPPSGNLTTTQIQALKDWQTGGFN